MSKMGITIDESSSLKKVEKKLSELPEWRGKYEYYHPFNSLEEEAAAKGEGEQEVEKEEDDDEEGEVGEDEERRKRRRA